MKEAEVRRSYLILALLALALAAPSAAVAAGAPIVTTTAATHVTSTSATLTGTVDPNGNDTTYYFEFGTTTAYGTKTATTAVPGNAKKKSASQAIGSLTPSMTYHFRLVATSGVGTTPGADQTFTTLASGQPPGKTPGPLSIASKPNPIVWGTATTISGRATGGQTAGLTVRLLENPYPYTGGYKEVATTTTSHQGRYAFTRRPRLNTRYQVVVRPLPGGPLTSAIVLVRVRMRVTLFLSDYTPARGQLVRFSGSVYPAHDGRVVYLQRRSVTGRYLTIARTRLRHALAGPRSTFSRRLRVRRSGVYRAYVAGHADHSAGFRTRTVGGH